MKGFTLIELLVVVLIIGILAAVALPQYQKAVDKARASEVVQLISTLQKATDLWILENSIPTQTVYMLNSNSTEELSVDIPCQYEGGQPYCYINKNTFSVEIYVNGTAAVYSYFDYPNYQWVTIAAMRDANGKWTHTCGYDGSRGEAICKGLQGQGYEAEEGWEL